MLASAVSITQGFADSGKMKGMLLMASIAQFATPAALSRVLPQSSPRKAVLTRSYLQSYLAGPVPSPMSSKIPGES